MRPETKRALLDAGAVAIDQLRREQPARGFSAIAVALTGCSMLPGSWGKRFARDMAAKPSDGSAVYSPKQRAHILRLAHTYRRQLPTSILILAQDLAEIERVPAPPIPTR